MAESYKALMLVSGFEPQIKAHLTGVESICCKEGALSVAKLLLAGQKHLMLCVVGGRNRGLLDL